MRTRFLVLLVFTTQICFSQTFNVKIKQEDQQGFKKLTAYVGEDTLLRTPFFDNKGISSLTPPKNATDCNCPDGYVVTGFNGRAGMWIDAISLQCTPFKNGVLGSVSELTKSVGGSSGEEKMLSNKNSIINNISISSISGNHLGEMSFSGYKVSDLGKLLNVPLGNKSTTIGNLTTSGNIISTYNFSIPPGYAIVGMTAYSSGNYLDGIAFQYRPLSSFYDFNFRWSDKTAAPVSYAYESDFYGVSAYLNGEKADSTSVKVDINLLPSEDPIFVDNSGRVGIGTKTPTSLLSVNGNAKVAGSVGIGSGDQPGLLSVKGISSVDGNMEVKGDLTVNGKSLNVVIPEGGIIMYSGTMAGFFSDSGLGLKGTPAEGWAICNGKNGTPDLQGRFIVGAQQNGTKYPLGATGGEETHTLTVNEMPGHSHVTPTPNYTINSEAGTWGSAVSLMQKTGDGQTSSSSSGGGQAHENRPPYYALFYIMKLKL